MHKPTHSGLATAAAVVALLSTPYPALAQQPSTWGPGAGDAIFAEMLRAGFRDAGPVKIDRLKQDDTQSFCSDPKLSSSPAGAKRAEEIEAANLATVKWPSDGKWLGDWRNGERIAQSGRGLTWTDPPTQANGGNCYNCHQIDAKEISFGTIGPSLHQYGRIKGMSEQTLKETWAKIYNSRSNNACSNMPRVGHQGILSEQNIKDLMALLLAPDSPVNR